jgi:hypothetical protein
VSPLAMTLDPSAALLDPPAPPPMPPALPRPFAPQVFRALTAALALAVAVLAIALVIRDVVRTPAVELASGARGETLPAPLRRDGGALVATPSVAPEHDAPSSVEPTVTAWGPAPDPSAAAATASSAHPSRRPSQALPSAYRLPPLGL